MAFKSADAYRKEKYGKMLVLPNDQDYVDAVIMYQSNKDVLVADVHYIKSDEYSGYVHCLGPGSNCPACNHITPKGERGIRIQPKLFIPLYLLSKNGAPLEDDEEKLYFFDRSMKFEAVLHSQVITNFPNPSEFVFRITRHGAAGDMDTKYIFQAVGRNSLNTFGMICQELGVENFTDYYETVCKSVDAPTMLRWLQSGASPNSPSVPIGSMVDYTVKPRGSSVPPPAPVPPSFISDEDMDIPFSDDEDAPVF